MSKIVAIKSYRDEEEKIGFLKKDIPETEEYKRMIRQIEKDRNRKIKEALISACQQSSLTTYLSE